MLLDERARAGVFRHSSPEEAVSMDANTKPDMSEKAIDLREDSAGWYGDNAHASYCDMRRETHEEHQRPA